MDNLHYFIILLYAITLTCLSYIVKICKNNQMDILYDI